MLRKYIRNQKEHHRIKSFEEEYIAILKRHNIPFERKWLFEANIMADCCRRFAACNPKWHRQPWAHAHGYMLLPLRG